ncbi:hypothetical protein BDV11DRAFT_199768 [Aspergillus similis]
MQLEPNLELSWFSDLAPQPDGDRRRSTQDYGRGGLQPPAASPLVANSTLSTRVQPLCFLTLAFNC